MGSLKQGKMTIKEYIEKADSIHTSLISQDNFLFNDAFVRGLTSDRLRNTVSSEVVKGIGFEDLVELVRGNTIYQDPKATIDVMRHSTQDDRNMTSVERMLA